MKLFGILAALAVASCTPAYAQPTAQQAAALDNIDAQASALQQQAATLANDAGAIHKATADMRALLTPVVVTPPVVTPPPVAATGALAVGLAVPDNDASGKPTAGASLDAFKAWFGRYPDYSYMNSSDDSSELASIQGNIAGAYGSAKFAKDRGIKPYWSIPFVLRGQTYAAAASGQYDAGWKRLAQYLVSVYGTANPIWIRPSHEFNGNWMVYSVQSGGEAAYVAAWQHYWGVMRAVCTCFRFEYNVALNNGVTSGKAARLQDGTTPPNVVAAYPGDLFVDAIGADVYDDPNAGTPAASWQANLKGWGASPSLTWLAAFATLHGKPITIPEWGVRPNAPSYIASIAAWMKANNVTLQMSWNRNDDYAGQMDSTANRDAYKAAFAQ